MWTSELGTDRSAGPRAEPVILPGTIIVVAVFVTVAARDRFSVRQFLHAGWYIPRDVIVDPVVNVMIAVEVLAGTVEVLVTVSIEPETAVNIVVVVGNAGITTVFVVVTAL